MKALSLTPGWADAVFWGEKTVEARTWQTDYRGDLLICASSRKQSGFIPGKALCIVTLTDIELFGPQHCEAAGFEPGEMPDKPSYAWHIDDVQWVEPFDVKGKLHLFDVPDEKIQLINPPRTKAEMRKVVRELFLPHVYIARGDDAARDFWEEVSRG
jgi:hypothetical protein